MKDNDKNAYNNMQGNNSPAPKKSKNLRKLLPYLAVAALFLGVTLAWNLLLPQVMKDRDTHLQQKQHNRRPPTNKAGMDTLSFVADTGHYSEKVGFITHRLNLSVEEAQVFWPVYNKYQHARDSIRHKQIKLLQNRETPSSKDSLTYTYLFKAYLGHYNELNRLRQHYHNEFLKVLPKHKVYQLYQAEQAFKKQVLKNIQPKP